MRRKMIAACGLAPADVILEIGAGRGEMTDELVNHGVRIFALEIDRRLCELLQDKYKNHPRVSVLFEDIMRFDIPAFCREHNIRRLKVIGNIPYYITTPIINCLISSKPCVEEAFLTVQKEFGKRIVALPGSKEYGSFSCFVQYYATPEILFYVSRSCFNPRPKVDSCFLKLKMRASPKVAVRDETLLFAVIRAAFNQRRKTLKNSLAKIIPSSYLEEFFRRYSLSPTLRAEMLSLEDFAHLVEMQ